MASRGVNGASESTLNDRFIKCEGCNVNIPKEDMIKAGNCTVCRRVPSNIRQLNMVEFTEATPKKISKRKRWTVLISKKGREYYYNTETGEECWEKPADFEAFASEEDQFGKWNLHSLFWSEVNILIIQSLFEMMRSKMQF